MQLRQAAKGENNGCDSVTPWDGKVGGSAVGKAMMFQQVSCTQLTLVVWTMLFRNCGPVVLLARARRASG